MKKPGIGIIWFLCALLYGQADQPLQYKVRVLDRAIPVYALDEKGNPVTDLKKEEIDLYVSNKKIDLDLFVFRKIFSDSADSTGQNLDQLASRVQERIVFLVIDSCRLPLKYAHRLKAIMKEIVQHGQPHDQFVIITSQPRNGNFLFAGPEPASPQLLQKIEKMKTNLVCMRWQPDYLRYAFQIFAQPKVVYFLSLGMARETIIPFFNKSEQIVRMFQEAGVPVLTIDIMDFQGPYYQEGLKYIADETGGRFLAHNDYTRILDEVKKTESAYYEAIFNLSNVPAFENHDIKFICRRKGVHLIAPKTIIHPKAYAKMTDFEKELFATNALEGGSWSQIQAAVKRPEFKTEKISGKNKLRFQVEVAIPKEMVNRTADIYLIRSTTDERDVKIKHLNRVLQKSENLKITAGWNQRSGFVIVDSTGQSCLASWLD